MLYHNIVNSDDNRLAKKIIDEQEKTNEEGTWYAEVAKHLKTLEIDKGLVKESTKSALKKMVKEKITKRMQCLINAEKKKSSKMRFLNGDEFQLRDYIKWGRGDEVLQTIKTRLNMLEIYSMPTIKETANYHDSALIVNWKMIPLNILSSVIHWVCQISPKATCVMMETWRCGSN